MNIPKLNLNLKIIKTSNLDQNEIAIKHTERAKLIKRSSTHNVETVSMQDINNKTLISTKKGQTDRLAAV